jgi:serine/threonine protein phosphatase PrpC
MAIRDGIELASLSDIGCQRDNNEDHFSYWEPPSDEQFACKGRLAIVADGMGGHEGGQEASRIAVEAIEQVYANARDGDPSLWLAAGFQEAHERILRHAQQHPGLQGMGTTCTAIALLGKSLYFAHVGDSRLYRVHGGNISRLTHDHSYVGRLVENGVITTEQAESHPQRHILTAALGAGASIAPDHPDQPIMLDKSDVLVVCTDGLWSMVSDEEIRTAAAAKPSEACRALLALATKRGGPDNITVQVIAVKA